MLMFELIAYLTLVLAIVAYAIWAAVDHYRHQRRMRRADRAIKAYWATKSPAFQDEVESHLLRAMKRSQARRHE